MANARNIESVNHKFPQFLASPDGLPEMENLTMAERRRRLGAGALKSFVRAEQLEQSPLQNIENTLKSKLVGQDKAVDAIVEALTRESLQNPNQPIANFMFLGPSGVGKTETAKILANLIHEGNDEDFDNLIRIDCSDYKGGHEIANLTGSPLGYVGSDKTPKLSRSAVEGGGGKTVILFDEIEKGSTELYDLMLHIMDDGTLETMGETSEKVSFSNSIIIMTSNLGSEEINRITSGKSTGFSPNVDSSKANISDKQIEISAMDAMGKIFRPEFINRISKNVIYNGFNDEQLGDIVDVRIDRENERYRDHGYNLTISEALRDHVVNMTEDRRQYNARTVLRNYEKTVESGLAEHYMAGTIPVGSEVYADLTEAGDATFMYSRSPALEYQAGVMAQARDQKRLQAKAEIARNQASRNQAEAEDSEYEESSYSQWTIHGEAAIIGTRVITDSFSLEEMYDDGEISAVLAFDVAREMGWLNDKLWVLDNDNPESDKNSTNTDKDDSSTGESD
ncbi:MAG: AAA family ATPase [bacterium]|nr:AAA family ATPase [bacterium]